MSAPPCTDITGLFDLNLDANGDIIPDSPTFADLMRRIRERLQTGEFIPESDAGVPLLFSGGKVTVT